MERHPDTILEETEAGPEQLVFSGPEMHDRLVVLDGSRAQDSEQDFEREHPVVTIIDDDLIMVGEAQLRLPPTTLYALNALRLAQGKAQTYAEIEKWGFRGARGRLSTCLSQLHAWFQGASVEPIMDFEITSVRGALEGRSYLLMPQVEFFDERIHSKLSAREWLIRKCVVLDAHMKPELSDDGSLTFRSRKKRIELAAQMIHATKGVYDADARLVKVFGGQVGWRRQWDAILKLGALPMLDPQREEELFIKKEKALEAYVLSEDLEDVMPDVITGVQAIFTLFAHHEDVIRRSASYRATWGKSPAEIVFQEAYQSVAVKIFESILAQPVHQEIDFRAKVATRARQEVSRVLAFDVMPPVSYGAEGFASYKIDIAQRELKTKLKRQATLQEIADHISLRVDVIADLMALRTRTQSLDAPYPGSSLGQPASDSLVGDKGFADRQLDQMERRRAIDALFNSETLLIHEKIILSLYYQIYHPSLAGAQLPEGGTFVYPSRAEDFDNIIGDEGLDFRNMGVKLLEKAPNYASSNHKRALRKARRILKEINFDMHGRSYAPEILEEEDKKREIIQTALKVSPDKPLKTQDIINLNRQEIFPNTSTIISLFNSIPEFAQACGFDVVPKRIKRGVLTKGLYSMSNDDIVDWALKVSPDKLLRRTQVDILAQDGEFIKYQTLLKRFKTVAAFHEACEVRRAAVAAAEAEPTASTTANQE